MKKIFKYLTMLGVAAALFSCAKKEIVFDHEKPAFDPQEGKILIEAIVPTTTSLDDEIYLVGPAAGGDSLAVWGDTKWRLTHSETISAKWGIYIDPADFHDGKTLADGFCFVSLMDGKEMNGKGEEITHTLAAQTGQSYNVYVSAWRSRFAVHEGGEGEGEGETLPDHDGVRIYIIDQTGWDEIALYQWGGVNDFGGGWPGAQVAGTITVAGETYKYFEYGDDVFGLSQHLIFNNNGNDIQLGDYDLTFEDGVKDYFFLVTAEGVEPLDAPAVVGPSIPEHDGVRVYIDDQTGWDEIALYQWGDINDFGGGWPGAQVTGTVTAGDVEYKYFEYGDDIFGLSQHLIFNNNGNDIQLGDYDLTFEDGVKDYFFLVTAAGVEAIESPFGGGSKPDPSVPSDDPSDEPSDEPSDDPSDEPSDETGEPSTLFVKDNSGWGENLRIYAWGSGVPELFGAWPGAEASSITTLGGITWKVFPIDASFHGITYNVIPNNKVAAVPVDQQVQYNGPAIVPDGIMFMEVSESAASMVEAPKLRILVTDNTGWGENLRLYAWGENIPELFGAWPGAAPSTDPDIDGVFFDVDLSNHYGQTYHLIFNNKVAAVPADQQVQYDGPVIELTRDYNISATDTAAVVEE